MMTQNCCHIKRQSKNIQTKREHIMEVFKKINNYVSFLDCVFILFVSFFKLQIAICNCVISPTICVVIPVLNKYSLSYLVLVLSFSVLYSSCKLQSPENLDPLFIIL